MRTAPPTLPRETRMLLRSEGSTTTLLESLTGLSLSVLVDYQNPIEFASVDPDAKDALGLSERDCVILRASRLVTESGETVSVNRVVFSADAVPWLVEAIDDVPLGHRLHRLHALQRRTILSYGQADWPRGDLEQECAYKTYVIHLVDDSSLYVHELFNPAFVPIVSQ
jgi:chorismate-pyruvate lyase